MRLKKLVTILTLLVIVLAATSFALSETWWDQVEVDGELYRASGSVNNSRGTFADTSTAYVQAETPSHLRVEVAHSHEGGTSWNEDFTNNDTSLSVSETVWWYRGISSNGWHHASIASVYSLNGVTHKDF